MTAEQILALKKPEQLFSGDDAEARQRYLELSKRWHPDRPEGRLDVFQRIASLYAEREARIKAGTWGGSTRLTLTDSKGRAHVLSVLASSPMDWGQSIVGHDFLAYLIDKSHYHLARHAIKGTGRFRYVDEKMREEFSRYLPNVTEFVMLEDGRSLLKIPKTPDLIRLRDVVTHLGVMPPKHVAWIVSSLMNLCCYLRYIGLVHLDISPDTYFISPQHHSGALLGGWWHWAERGMQLVSVPRRTYNVLPFKVTVDKLASSSIDFELVRLTAREVAPSLPEPMQTWLKNPGTGHAVAQYTAWQTVLAKTFGKRRFENLSVTAAEVYGNSVKTN